MPFDKPVDRLVEGLRANGAIQLRNSEHYAVSGELIEPL